MSDERNKPHIRNAIDARRKYDGSQLEFSYNEEKLEKENRYRVKGRAFPKYIDGFNWGACILGPIWGIGNNSPVTFLIILFGLLPYVGAIMALLFSLYCGVKGNEWAWKNKEWKDMDDFHNTQRKGAWWGIITEIVLIIIAAICSFIIATFITKNI